MVFGGSTLAGFEILGFRIPYDLTLHSGLQELNKFLLPM